MAIEEKFFHPSSFILYPVTVVIGGGAAGFFAAVNCNERVILLERSNQLLSKVKISGGGRCNVTHNCFDPKRLIQNYPRGAKELLGPFTKWGPKQTIDWFESRGTLLKVEDDGRYFPISDSSSSIIECLLKAASDVDIRLQSRISSVRKEKEEFIITFESGEILRANRLILATGSSSKGFDIASSFGHTIIEPVPSLFTFNVPSSPLKELSGITCSDVEVEVEGFSQRGPLLITHFGFSGPAVLKLSAFAARKLYEKKYNATLAINWISDHKEESLINWKKEKKNQIGSENPFFLPKSLWRKLLEKAGLDPNKKLSDVKIQELKNLYIQLSHDLYLIEGKTTHKEEFVTAGGVCLKEVNFKTMESKLCPGLHFAGEILDIDGVTGGFNFQNAWTTGYLAAQ